MIFILILVVFLSRVEALLYVKRITAETLSRDLRYELKNDRIKEQIRVIEKR